MKNSLFPLVLLLLLPCALVGARVSGSPRPPGDDQTVTVVGMVLSAASSVPRGATDRWRIDLNDDMDAELTLLKAGVELAGNPLVEPGLKVEVVITPLDPAKSIYGLVRWVRIGLRR